MTEEEKDTSLQPVENNLPDKIDVSALNAESKDLLNQIIQEKDLNKVQDLTHLFNAAQTKKTLARVDKMSILLDALTDQAIERLTNRPDEISNKELMDGMKTVQDLIERGQQQASNSGDEINTFIQINQTNNEVHVGDEETTANTLSRESREKVKNAVAELLKSFSGATPSGGPQQIISTEYEDKDNINIELEDTENDK